RAGSGRPGAPAASSGRRGGRAPRRSAGRSRGSHPLRAARPGPRGVGGPTIAKASARSRPARARGSELLDELVVRIALRLLGIGGLRGLLGVGVALELVPGAVRGGADPAEAQREVVGVGDVLQRLVV